MTRPRDPSVMDADAIRAEIAHLLARGFLRHIASSLSLDDRTKAISDRETREAFMSAESPARPANANGEHR